MSVDFYMACEKCKSSYHIAQDGFSGFTFYSGEPRCMAGLGAWLREHILCDPRPRLLTEHEADQDDGWIRAEWPSAPPDER